MPEQITIEGLIRNAIEARLLDVHTCIPVIVEAVNGNNVDVAIAVKRIDNNGEEFAAPTIPDVPVLFYGNASISIAHAVVKGDEGMVLFCERDISSFVESGTISKPVVLRKHEYSDAVFIPLGVSSNNRVSIPSSGVTITGDVIVNGNIRLEGSIEATGEVTAIADGASVGLSTHQHGNGNNGAPTDAPIGGT